MSLTVAATMFTAMMLTLPMMDTLTPTLCPAPPPMLPTILATWATMPVMVVMVVQMPFRRAEHGTRDLGASLRDRATLPSPLRGLGPSGGYPSRLHSLRSFRASLGRRLAALTAVCPTADADATFTSVVRPVAAVVSCSRFAHRLPHRARHLCPLMCGHFRLRLRQRAAHDCLRLRPHHPHSIAVAAPLHRLRRRRFPLRSPSDSRLFLRPAACGSHTGRSRLQVGCMRTLIIQFRGHFAPFGARSFPERAYSLENRVSVIGLSAGGCSGPRLSCTDTRTYALRLRGV